MSAEEIILSVVVVGGACFWLPKLIGSMIYFGNPKNDDDDDLV